MRGQRYGVQVSHGSYAGPRDVHLAPRGYALGQGAAAVSVPDAAIATAWAANGWARTLLRWVVALSSQPDAITLTRNGKPLDTDALWQAAATGGAPMGYSAYRRMLLHSLELSFEITKVAQADYHQQRAPVPPNEVRIYRQRNGRFLLITCGYGRLRQPGGVESKGSAFLELALELSDHHSDIAKALSTLGMLLHAKPDGETPIVPGDRLQLQVYGLDRFLFLPLIKVTPKRGPSIHLVSPLPLTEDEYRRVSQRGTFDADDYDQRVRDRWLTVVGKPM